MDEGVLATLSSVPGADHEEDVHEELDDVQPDGEGIIQFTQHIKMMEREDQEVN